MVGDHLCEVQDQMTDYVTIGGQLCEVVGTEDSKRCAGCIDLSSPPYKNGRRHYSNGEIENFDLCSIECMNRSDAKIRAHQCCQKPVRTFDTKDGEVRLCSYHLGN